MLIIFDFDYTLFDMFRFKKALARAFKLSAKVFLDDYKKHFKDKKINYDVGKHFRILKQAGKIKKEDEKILEENIKNLFESANRFIFPKAEKALKKLKTAGHNLILISFGDKKFQGDKIKNTNIAQHFSKIIITGKHKSESLEFLKSETKKILIVNDNALESVAIKKTLGRQSKIFLVKSPYSQNIEHQLKIYADLGELYHLCKR